MTRSVSGLLSAARSAARDERNVSAVEAEVVQFANGEAVQLLAGRTVAAPFVERASDVHCRYPVYVFSLFCLLVVVART